MSDIELRLISKLLEYLNDFIVIKYDDQVESAKYEFEVETYLICSLPYR